MNNEQVCHYSIENAEERFNTKGRALTGAFIIGPSESVKKYGKVIVELAPSTDKKDDKNDKKDKNNNNNNNDENNNNNDNNNNDNNSNNDNNDNESYNYSILKSYINIFEDTNADTNTNSSFEPGQSYSVDVILPDNGYTKWIIQLDSRLEKSAINKVIDALESKDFKSAKYIAAKNIKYDDKNNATSPGLVPLSVTTYLNKNNQCPFMGHCKFSIDSGSESNSYSHNSASDTTHLASINLCVGPYDGIKTDKINESTLFIATYDVNEDITNGKAGDLAIAISNALNNDKGYNDNTATSSEADASNKLSEYIKKVAFPNIHTGNSQHYENFKKIKDTINKWLQSKQIIYAKQNSTDINKYKNKFNNTFIFF